MVGAILFVTSKYLLNRPQSCSRSNSFCLLAEACVGHSHWLFVYGDKCFCVGTNELVCFTFFSFIYHSSCLYYNLKLSKLIIFWSELIFSARNEQTSSLNDCTKKSSGENDFTILLVCICLLYQQSFLRLKHANALPMLAMFDWANSALLSG